MTSNKSLKRIIDKFICENCEDYLRPPISFCSGGTTICGSCSQLLECKNDIIGRCQTLENIGGILKFPCSYSEFGCKVYVSWDEASYHENQCLHKQFKCPICINDHWKGTATALKFHIRTVHKDLLFTNKCYISWLTTCNELFLLIIGNELYVLIYENDATNNLLWFSLKWIGSKQQANRRHFKLTISLPNGEKYFERKQLESAETWSIDKNLAVKIDLCVLKMKMQMEDKQLIQLRLDVYLRVPYNGCADENFLKDVECLVCQDFMTTPIFQCTIGHSFCSFCTPKLKKCPICRENISYRRNFALESICSKINFRCLYANDGCLFTSTLNDVIFHEIHCNFGFVDCPLKSFVTKCNWRGKLEQVKAHTSNMHGINFEC